MWHHLQALAKAFFYGYESSTTPAVEFGGKETLISCFSPVTVNVGKRVRLFHPKRSLRLWVFQKERFNCHLKATLLYKIRNILHAGNSEDKNRPKSNTDCFWNVSKKDSGFSLWTKSSVGCSSTLLPTPPSQATTTTGIVDQYCKATNTKTG